MGESRVSWGMDGFTVASDEESTKRESKYDEASARLDMLKREQREDVHVEIGLNGRGIGPEQ